MISRRQFLLYLTAFSAVFGASRTIHGKSHEFTALAEPPDLYLYNGWVLRSDDLSGSLNPDRES